MSWVERRLCERPCVEWRKQLAYGYQDLVLAPVYTHAALPGARVGGGHRPTDRQPFQRRRRTVIPKPQGQLTGPAVPGRRECGELLSPRARYTESAENRAERALGDTSRNDPTLTPTGPRDEAWPFGRWWALFSGRAEEGRHRWQLYSRLR